MRRLTSTLAALALTASMAIPALAQGGYSEVSTISSTNPSDNCRLSVQTRLVTQGAQPVSGASVTDTAHYKTTDTTMIGTTDSNGAVTLVFDISRATYGYRVPVDVSVQSPGGTINDTLYFTPQQGGPCDNALAQTMTIGEQPTATPTTTPAPVNTTPTPTTNMPSRMPDNGAGGMAVASLALRGASLSIR